ncbi:MAG TPA: hypothetical protein DCK95_02540 [Anaerolineaceae bacterium]|nr:hypothetical protein [Anaerolineaceae bacterium]
MEAQKRILLFSHSSRQAVAKRVFQALCKTGLSPENIIIADENSEFAGENLKANQAYVILYTLELERDAKLFEVIQAIEQDSKAGTFFIFPNVDRKQKNPFPKIFHSLRFRQHYLYAYTQKGNKVDVTIFLESLVKDVQAYLKRIDEEEQFSASPETKKTPILILKNLWKNPRSRTILLLMPVFVVLIIYLIGLVPSTVETVQKAQITPVVVPPPDMREIWLEETFNDAFFHEEWNVSHRYRGKNHFNINFDGTALVIMAEPPIVDVVYSMESSNSYLLEELQALRMEFFFDPLVDPGSSTFTSMQLVQIEGAQYSLECRISPTDEQGMINCSIHEPDNSIALIGELSFSFGEWHSLTVSFDPTNYVVQLFLDDLYKGEAEIPSVEYWRDREMKVVFITEVQDLLESGYSYQLDNIVLSRQP